MFLTYFSAYMFILLWLLFFVLPRFIFCMMHFLHELGTADNLTCQDYFLDTFVCLKLFVCVGHCRQYDMSGLLAGHLCIFEVVCMCWALQTI